MAAVLASIAAALVLVGLSVGFVMDSAYANRILPGSVLAGRDLSGIATDQIGPILDQAQASISADITVGGQTVTATGTDLGITVDRDQITSVLEENSNQHFWIYRWPHITNIPLTVSIDADHFNTWLRTKFPGTFVTAVDATLVFDPDTTSFSTSASVPGLGVSNTQIQSIAGTLAVQSGRGAFTITPSPIPADVTDNQAAALLDWANQRLQTECSITQDGQVLYTLTPSDIGSFAVAAPISDGNGASEGITVNFDAGKIKQFITTTLAPSLDKSPTQQKVIVDQNGTTLAVLQAGSPGTTLASLDDLADQISTCLVEGQNCQIEADFTDTSYDDHQITVTIADPPPGAETSHWTDVDLTSQTVTLMDGSTPTATYLLSSGAPTHPTPTGLFHVYAKVASQSLSGCVDGDDCYYYTDVHWATWFYLDYGFHTAYWHNDFGQAVSHGCLNLPEDQAKAVYDWVSIGTAVNIHD